MLVCIFGKILCVFSETKKAFTCLYQMKNPLLKVERSVLLLISRFARPFTFHSGCLEKVSLLLPVGMNVPSAERRCPSSAISSQPLGLSKVPRRRSVCFAARRMNFFLFLQPGRNVEQLAWRHAPRGS